MQVWQFLSLIDMRALIDDIEFHQIVSSLVILAPLVKSLLSESILSNEQYLPPRRFFLTMTTTLIIAGMQDSLLVLESSKN